MYSASMYLAFQWGLSKHQALAQADKIWQWHPFLIVCTSVFSYQHTFHITCDVVPTRQKRGQKKFLFLHSIKMGKFNILLDLILKSKKKKNQK